jgi:oligopeptidase B
MLNRKLNPIRVQTIRSKLEKYSFKKTEVNLLLEFDRSKYTCSQIHVKSHDGKDIPVTLIHRKDLELNGRYDLNKHDCLKY